MCGIAGIIHHETYDLNQLIHSLYHRGPDDQKIYVEKNLALVHTRLAIQDIKHGQQPFFYGDYAIIFNGEIYNHMRLRQHLQEFTFQTRSDTETLLLLYIKYKEKCFDLLDGMYAFCIYDRQSASLILARDRAGKKPLYYTSDNKSFIFASELNAIKAIKKLTIDEEAVYCYLRAGFVFNEHTIYKEVYEVEAGSYLTVPLKDHQFRSFKYFSILEDYHQQNRKIPLNTAMGRVEEVLRESVLNRLSSADVEVGAFLSGGIDSNLVVAMASQLNKNIRTFTIKFTQGVDESPLARVAANHYGTQHTEIEISYDLEKDIERILLNYGEPFLDSSAVPSYYVAKEARKHVKVILNGDGADELFGGYRRYVAIANYLPQFARLFAPIKRFLPKPNQKVSLYNYFYRLMAMASKSGLDFYLSATNDIYEDYFVFSANPITTKLDHFVRNILEDPQLSALSKILYLDFNLLLFSDLLVKMDIATMAHSLEGRSPFLSKQMLSLAPTLPDQYKINKLTTKYILRQLAKKYLPPSLIHQPKRGFEVPLKQWVNSTLKNKIYDSLLPGCYSENFIHRKFIDKLLGFSIDISQEKRAKILWSLFCLEVWHRHETIALSP